MRRLLLLLAGVLAFWLVVGLPARWLGGGDLALLACGAALLVCLVPTAATLIWAERAWKSQPDTVVLAVLGGTGVRVFAVLAGGFVLTRLVDAFRDGLTFWGWLVAAYLYTLALEVTLLLLGRPAPGTEAGGKG